MTLDEKFMKKSIALAKRGEGKTFSNPMVGALVVKDDKIVGSGYHKKFGDHHAEVYALKGGGENCVGATLYVSLEPCSHYGKTAPCSELIVKAGIKRVVIGSIDPNPLVSGGGVKFLRENNIEVVYPILEDECKKINQPFFKYIAKKIPYIFLKSAITLDGKIATSTGSSKWITNDLVFKKVHYYRNKFSAILTGVNTVLLDNPELTARGKNFTNPARFIIDPNLKMDLASKISKTAHTIETYLITSKDNQNLKRIDGYKKMGFKFIFLKGKIFLMKNIVKKIGAMGFPSIMVEAGERVVSAFFKENLIDAGEIFVAPKIVGDSYAKPFVSGLNILNIGKAFKLDNTSFNIYGNNFGVEFFNRVY